METRVPYVFGLESVQEFQVSINPYSPAYGGGAAGYVNTITKSGTNAFHGARFLLQSQHGARARRTPFPRRKVIPGRWMCGSNSAQAVGGPVVKNKLFFFFDYEQQRRKDPISIINTAQSAFNVTSFGVPAGTVLPAPDGYPVPSALSVATPTSPIYLQQVSERAV